MVNVTPLNLSKKNIKKDNKEITACGTSFKMLPWQYYVIPIWYPLLDSVPLILFMCNVTDGDIRRLKQ